MTIDQLEEVLREFDRNFGNVQKNEFIHGIQAVVDGDQIKVEILIDAEAKDKANVASLGLPKQFSFAASHGEVKVEIVPLVRNQARPLAEIGTFAYGDGLGGNGTLGWNLKLDDKYVCLSNWHILCPNGNDTPRGGNNPASPGLKIYLSGTNARLLDFVPVRLDQDNNWDLAYGEYIYEWDCEPVVRRCFPDDLQYDYPTQLTPTSLLRPGSEDKYWTVGDTDPICQSGTLRGIAQRRKCGPFKDGISYWFADQLVFSWESGPGDSGSIIVHESSNTVTGLLFAGTEKEEETETVANPLYKAPWAYKGLTYIPETKSHIPVFETSEAFRSMLSSPRTSASVIEIPTRDRDLAVLNSLDTGRAQRLATIADDRTKDGLPSLTTGLSILGMSIEKTRRGNSYPVPRWLQEAPEGTRQSILVMAKPFYQDEVLLYYLCLGNQSAGRPVLAIGTLSRPDATRWQVSSPEVVPVESGGFGRQFKGWSPSGTDLILGEIGGTGSDSDHWVLGETVIDGQGRLVRQPPIPSGSVTTSYPILDELECHSRSSGHAFVCDWVRKSLTCITMTGEVPQQP